MKTSSTDKFCIFVTTMERNHMEGVNFLTIDLHLHEHNKYNEMIANNKWETCTTGKNQQSVFAYFCCGDPSYYEN